MFSFGPVVPFLFFVVWLGVIIYLILLATRLVNAVEQIAQVVTQRFREPPNL